MRYLRSQVPVIHNLHNSALTAKSLSFSRNHVVCYRCFFQPYLRILRRITSWEFHSICDSLSQLGLVSQFKGGDFERICTNFAQIPVLLHLMRFLGVWFWIGLGASFSVLPHTQLNLPLHSSLCLINVWTVFLTALKETGCAYPWHSLGEVPGWLLAWSRLLCFARTLSKTKG